MASTVRVELPGDPPKSAYDKLHEKMGLEGFIRTVTDDNSGVEYDLPHAEYNYPKNADKSNVLNKAKAAAKAAGYSSAKILVTQSKGRTWENLDEH